MLDYTAIHLAVRAHALALVAVTTGVTTLRATPTGYERTDGGSFLADGFWPGMEVRPVGFAQATPATIRAVTAHALTLHGGRTPEAAAPNRSLTVGLPSQRAWENRALEPTPPAPYVAEQFVDGPSRQISFGPGGALEADPMYVLQFHVPQDTDLAPSVYADAVIRHFPPGLALPLANGDVVRVRHDVAPYRTQLQPSSPGFVVKVVRIPLRLRTANSH